MKSRKFRCVTCAEMFGADTTDGCILTVFDRSIEKVDIPSKCPYKSNKQIRQSDCMFPEWEEIKK